MDGTQVDTICTQPGKFRYRVSDELAADAAIAIFRQRSVVLNAADSTIRVELEGYESDDLIVLHCHIGPIGVHLAEFARMPTPATLQIIIARHVVGLTPTTVEERLHIYFADRFGIVARRLSDSHAMDPHVEYASVILNEIRESTLTRS